MGSDPLVISVGGWQLELKINDLGLEVRMHTDDFPVRTHYMRLGHKQAHAVLDYLDNNLSVLAE